MIAIGDRRPALQLRVESYCGTDQRAAAWPVYAGDFPDPCLIRAEGYEAYGTNAGGVNVLGHGVLGPDEVNPPKRRIAPAAGPAPVHLGCGGGPGLRAVGFAGGVPVVSP
jgi:hypothetical protein